MKTNTQIMVLLFVLALSACQVNPDELRDEAYAEDYRNIVLYYGDFTTIPRLSFVPSWIDAHTTFIAGLETRDPREVVESGLVDCDGVALLYANIAYVKFGLKCSLCLTNYSRSILSGGKVNHAVVRLPDGTVIEPQTGEPYTGSIGYEYTFDEVFIKE